MVEDVGQMKHPCVFYLNRQQRQPRVDVDYKFEDSNLDEIEEEAEEFENDISESILDHSFDEIDEEIIEEEEEEEEFVNDVSESILDEEIVEEEEEEFVNDVSESIFDEEIVEEEEEEFVNDVSESILDNSLDEEIIEEEEFEVDISENMETRMEFDEINEGYDQQQGLNQTSGRRARRTARMSVNTNYVHIVHEIVDEEEEVEDDVNEFMDQDMYEYFETRTYYAPPTMDVDGNDDEEEEAACAICLLEYKDEDTIATLQCGHEFHDECINKWLQRKNTCPFCRVSVLPTNT